MLLELKEREAQKNLQRLHSNVKWLQLMMEEEDRQAPAQIGPAPRSHEEIKRSGYYHQLSERFFPKHVQSTDIDFDRKRRFSVLSRESEESVPDNTDNATMVEKTVEVMLL
ncbi:unnamed protein product [Gongylonema pulchrum]|uniref:Uncharacterized protein n=1 Tax=Gongylonema pulchrum TaxID=637853 RepID=A0A3P6RGP7_9BILA|nr:unnamed protein product [Gongylonema pulchrum]